MSPAVSRIVEVSMKQNSIVYCVRVDEWTTE